jgi:hypothetical protein
LAIGLAKVMAGYWTGQIELLNDPGSNLGWRSWTLADNRLTVFGASLKMIILEETPLQFKDLVFYQTLVSTKAIYRCQYLHQGNIQVTIFVKKSL